MRAHPALIAILIVYAVLAVGYGLATPLWEAPDEPSHYLYVEYVATYGTLPPPGPPQRGPFYRGYATTLYEWYQPPLYYVLAAPTVAAARWLKPESFPQIFPDFNPDFAQGAVNLFTAPADRSPAALWSSPGPRIARLFSVLLGVLTLAVTYRLALAVTRGDELVALTAVGFMAFIPQFTFLTAYVTNDNLADLMAVACLLVYVGWLDPARPVGLRRAAGAGVLVALALLTKLTLLFVLPLGWLALTWRCVARRKIASDRRAELRAGAAFTLVGLGAPALLFVTVPALWERLAYSSASLAAKPELTSAGYIAGLLPEVHASFWGRFGWMTLATPGWIPGVMAVIAAVGLLASLGSLVPGLARALGGAGVAAECERLRPVPWRAAVVGMWVTLALVAFGFVRFNLAVRQPQGRLLFPGLSAFAVLVAFGLLWLAGPRRRWVARGLVLVMLLLNLASLFGYLLPAFGR